METVRLTTAAALVRYLIAQRIELDGDEAPLFPGVFAIFGHGNVTSLGLALQEARGGAADLARPERAGHGAGRGGLREGDAAPAGDGRDVVRRARRHQHGDRGGRGAGQPPAAAAAVRRHVREPPARPGAAAGRALRRPLDHRQRRVPPGRPLLGSHHRGRSSCCRPCRRPSRRCSTRRTAAPRSSACRRTCRRRPTTSRPASSSRVVHEIPRPRASETQLRRAAELLRGARRPLLIAGGGVHYSLAEDELARFAEAHGVPVAETMAGKASLVDDHPALRRADRRHRRRPRPTRSPPRPTSCSPSAPACRTSPPARGRSSATRRCGWSRSTSPATTP